MLFTVTIESTSLDVPDDPKSCQRILDHIDRAIEFLWEQVDDGAISNPEMDVRLPDHLTLSIDIEAADVSAAQRIGYQLLRSALTESVGVGVTHDETPTLSPMTLVVSQPVTDGLQLA